ncbi:MAG TPA: AAA family ATPase, partial [Solirubrobacterales bacterium]
MNHGHLFAAEVGPPYRRAYAVIGDTVNVAARLMAKAPVSHVYASAAVIERARTSFKLQPLPSLTLKGRRGPLAAFDVGPVTDAIRLRPALRRPPLVGRDQELAVIQNAISAARRRSGGLVEIIGETGSGKSRLLAEGRRLARGMRVLHTTCQAYTRETPYASAAHALRQLVGLDAGADDAKVLATLRSEVARRLPNLKPWLPLLAIAFGVPTELTPEVEQLSPEVRARKLQETVHAFAEPDLAIPTLLQVEHAHLIDAASAGLLRSFAEQLDRTSWAVLLTRRPVGHPPLETAAHAQIELGPLTHEQAMALAATIPESERIPPHVLELAVRRAAGSPEFLLDLLAAAAAGNRESLPASLSAAAAARLDELEPTDRTLVCRAAVLGLSFEPDAVRYTLEPGMAMPDDDRWSRLSGVFVRDPGGQLRFKRPALQEAAYASLPFKLRRRLHVAVAEALERRPAGLESVLSHHWHAAGEYARAHRYAMLAAASARQTFSHADAVGLYRRAIEAGRAAALDSEPEGRAALGNAWEEL